MKVTQKRFFLSISCVLLVLFLVGCGGRRQTTTSIAGRYTRGGYQDEYLILNQDGTYTKKVREFDDVTAKPYTSSGSWKFENNALALVDQWADGPSENEVVTVKGNRIIIEYPYALFGTKEEVWVKK